MRIRIQDHSFTEKKLVLLSPMMSIASHIELDGERIHKKNGVFVVEDDEGERVEIKVKARLFSLLPSIEFDGELVDIESPFGPFETAFALLPMFLIIIGGALGGIIGAVAVAANFSLLQSRLARGVQYLAAC